MKPETTSLLYAVKDDLTALRYKLDDYMYRGGETPPKEDLAYLRKVYNAICKVQDLL